VACVNCLMMWHSCMSRKISLVDQTNISIYDFSHAEKNKHFST
jgi:hypothetical protein